MQKTRYWQFALLLNLFFLFGCFVPNHISAQTTATKKLTPREIAQQTLPSTVLLVMGNSVTKKAKSGSGFFVAEDIVVTNFHVIKETTKGYAKVYGQDKIFEVLGVVGIDEENDLALLKIRGIKGKPLKLNTDDATAVGDEVFAVGNPKGLEGTFSQGIVSSIRKTEKKNLLQITASISPGSSGGAVLNEKGEVVGVAVGAIDGGQSLNFAIPVSLLRILLSSPKSIVLLNNTKSITSNSQGTKNRYKQFKVSDLINENLLNNVKSVKEYISPAEMKLGNIKLGKPTEISVTEYDSVGNIKSRIFNRSALYAKDPYLDDFVPGLKPDYDNSATTFRHEYDYDYVNKTVTIKYYASIGNVEEYKGLTVIKYENSEITERINYDLNKKLLSKIVLLNDKNKKSVEIEFGDDEQECKRKEIFSYINEKNEKVSDVKFKSNGCYVGSNYVEVLNQARNEIEKNFLDKANNPYTIITKILDNKTKLTNRAIIVQKEKDSFMPYQEFKYEYQFDSKGNWINRIAYELKSESAKAYFEPFNVIKREITYY